MERTWILVGMMGAGKSSVGRALAELAQRQFADTDILLQNRFGRPISQIFETYGESTFRDHESSILRGLEPGAVVLATGGGIVQRPENWDQLRRLGRIAFLSASEEIILERLRLSRKRRPLLETEDWESRVRSLIASRRPFYEQADIVVDVNSNEIDQAAERVLAAFRSLE